MQEFFKSKKQISFILLKILTTLLIFPIPSPLHFHFNHATHTNFFLFINLKAKHNHKPGNNNNGHIPNKTITSEKMEIT